MQTREEWLVAAAEKICVWFNQHKVELEPSDYKITCGWPSRSATSATKRRIGECWARKCSDTGKNEMFISPTLEDSFEVADVLGHEMIHAADDCKSGHGAGFRKLCKATGWTRNKPTSAAAEGEAAEFLRDLVKQLGPYPHQKLTPGTKKKADKCRLLKAECEGCGMIIRTTQKWADETGLPICACGSKFVSDQLDTDEEDSDDDE